MTKRWSRTLVGAAAAAVIVVAGVAAYWLTHRAPAVRYVTEPVARGDVQTTITASGTINPVITVQVGTYVSGTIVSLTCDFNTRVHKGQLCAKIDPAPYQIIVDEDTADLDDGPGPTRQGPGQRGLHQAGQRPRGAAALGELRLARRRRLHLERLPPGARARRRRRGRHQAEGRRPEGRPDQSELHQHRLAGGWDGGDARHHRRPDRGGQPADPDPVPHRHRPDQDAGRHQRQRVRHRRRGAGHARQLHGGRVPKPHVPRGGGAGPPVADQRAERDHLRCRDLGRQPGPLAQAGDDGDSRRSSKRRP